MCMVRPEDVPSYVRAARRQEEEARRARENSLQITIRPHSRPIRFSTAPLAALGIKVDSENGDFLDQQIWEALGASELSRQLADAAVAEQLPGYIFGWRYDMIGAKESAFHAVDCTDPALVLGVLARVKDGFYQSDRTPDYSVRHLSETVFLCCDPRVPVRQAEDSKKEAL